MHRQEFGKGLFSILQGVGENHLPHGSDAVLHEEHVLSTGQPYALGTEGVGNFALFRFISVGSYAQPAHLVGPSEKLAEGLADGGVHWIQGALYDRPVYFRGVRGYLTEDHLSLTAVQGDPIALLHHPFTVHRHLAVLVADVQSATAGHANFTHLASHQSSVGGHTAPGREDPLSGVHTADVVW